MVRKVSTQTASFLSKLILKKSWLLVTISILVVLIATLYPFNFSFVDNLSIKKIVSSFNNDSYFKDIVGNILLFIPLGCSFTAFLNQKHIKPISKVFALVIISAGLSLTVEILQIFLDSRSPTPADITNNTIGGIVGMACFYTWHSASITSILAALKKSMARNYTTKIILLVFGYILLSFLIVIPWQSMTNLSNWNLTYPIMLGNEKNGARPWNGYISEVTIADKAFSENEILKLFNPKNYLHTIGNSLIGSYQLTEGINYQDNNKQLPKLLPQRQPSSMINEKGIALSSSYWLKTETPTISLSNRIRKSSQFTIVTNIATADTTQTGPARIISLSANNLHRNFTLGQQESNLNVRIRTPITGENATDIILNAPGVFANTDSHSLVITYAQAKLKIYVDNLQNYYSFNLLELIAKEQKILYYVITFVPLSIYLTLLTILLNKNFRFYRFLLLTGIILPSVILETFLAIHLEKSFSLINILIGILLTSSIMLILRLRTSTLIKKAAIQ